MFILEHYSKKLLESRGINKPEVFLVLRELASNILKYGKNGRIDVALTDDGVNIIAENEISVDNLKNGKKGLGLGWKIISNHSDFITIRIIQQKKVIFNLRINLVQKEETEKKYKINYSVLIEPHYLEKRSGDFFYERRIDDGCYLFVLGDVLGHGEKAFEVAEKVKEKLNKTEFYNINEVYIVVEEALANTRGAVLFICFVYDEKIEYINVGNINANLIQKKSIKKLLNIPGIVGRQYVDRKVFNEEVNNDYILIATTDGIRGNFLNYINPMRLFLDNIDNIAREITEKFKIKDDDSSVFVLRKGG
ncbi:hypothetical protein [Thermovenabulum sp.]|uniref:hypothetical protein n=1 Tax=Thermovenabulum sp. TaxID=3100335 RepID=UPI003C7D0A8C